MCQRTLKSNIKLKGKLQRPLLSDAKFSIRGLSNTISFKSWQSRYTVYLKVLLRELFDIKNVKYKVGTSDVFDFEAHFRIFSV
jgi:hypothetical protein